MKRFAIPAVLVAAFLATSCGETEEVCRTYGNRTVCRTERVKSYAERERSLKGSMKILDRTGRESTHQLLPRANGWDGTFPN